MNPNSNNGPTAESLSLPSPVEQGQVNGTPGVEALPAPAPMEVSRPAGEAVNQNSGMSLPYVQTTVDPTVQLQSIAPPVQTPAVATAGPAMASDVDVIEKEWVNKAKTIVNQTRQDPYMQEKQVSELQADYLKKRYGKDVKQAGN